LFNPAIQSSQWALQSNLLFCQELHCVFQPLELLPAHTINSDTKASSA